jgi:hypothetical protein
MERQSRTRMTVSEMLVIVLITALLLLLAREMTWPAAGPRSFPGAGRPAPSPRPPFRLLRLDVRACGNSSTLEVRDEARFSQFPG